MDEDLSKKSGSVKKARETSRLRKNFLHWRVQEYVEDKKEPAYNCLHNFMLCTKKLFLIFFKKHFLQQKLNYMYLPYKLKSTSIL